jgi:cobalt transporter subunit CbtB
MFQNEVLRQRIDNASAFSKDRIAIWPVALVAIVLGAAQVFAVGFANPQWIHNAAHDVRHSINTPCH